MGCKRKKKGESGEVTKYITRNAAVKKLQLSLRDFRRLCILKGIYPREPRNRKKVQKGNSQIKTLYYMKDIQFLSHEPIIWKFREHRAYMKKLHKAEARNEEEKVKSLWQKKPIYRLDHIVRERYPTFIDALRDLDDPLTLCFLFSRLARVGRLQEDMINMCRRLTVEFMHYVIEANALRKVFISFKGYYYQAEIMGQTVNWIVPHPFTPRNTTDTDIRLMRIFAEFYITLLGFVNFRLYHSLNINYPPKLRDLVKGDTEEDEYEIISERVASLNIPLQRNRVDDNDEENDIDTHLIEEDAQELQAAREEAEKRKKQQSLFKGLKFYLNRETNMESLTFAIRACMGEVSWDKLSTEGSTYLETDETITHQIVDRMDKKQKYLSRYYVQPQWVYDCINARLLLPVQDYFPGATLPAHLSPFDGKPDSYVPPEMEELLARQRGELPDNDLPNMESDSEDSEDENEENHKRKKVKKGPTEVENQEVNAGKEKGSGTKREPRPKKMVVRRGLPTHTKKVVVEKQEREEKRLAVMMIPRKQKKMYHILRRKEERQDARVKQLKEKRKAIEAQKNKKKRRIPEKAQGKAIQK